ncbi:MAG: NUDIX hydrolase [Nitrososphaerota archaeon]|nr:NUDIX hydrolase [Nitrososphaerota archaeon]
MTVNGKENSIVETVLSSETVYTGHVVKLVRKQVRFPTGRTMARDIVEHPGSVGIVPLLDDGRIILIRQFRLATAGVIWEIPAGTLEDGESPEACARRELEEETGYSCGSLDLIFKCYLAPGYTTELMHMFVAKALVKTRQHTEEDEMITTHQASPVEALQMIGSGDIRDAKTISAISYLVASGKLHS